MAANANAEPRTAAELIQRVQIDWAALEYVVAGLSEAELTTPVGEGWAIKDHLAHIAEWERATTAVLARRPQWEGFRLDQAGYARLGDVDQINELLYERNRYLSVSAVQASARAAHAELLAALARLTDADVQNTIAGYGSDPTDTRPLLGKIAGDTYGHYAEHTGWIKAQFFPRTWHGTPS